MALGSLITGVSHIGIRVHAMDRARAFYERLGFKFIAGPIGPEPVAILTHPSGIVINFILNARESDAPNVLMDIPQKHPGFTHVALDVSDVMAAKAELQSAGIVITEGPITFPNGSKSIFVRDPDRNVIEFNQAPG